MWEKIGERERSWRWAKWCYWLLHFYLPLQCITNHNSHNHFHRSCQKKKTLTRMCCQTPLSFSSNIVLLIIKESNSTNRRVYVISCRKVLPQYCVVKMLGTIRSVLHMHRNMHVSVFDYRMNLIVMQCDNCWDCLVIHMNMYYSGLIIKIAFVSD